MVVINKRISSNSTFKIRLGEIESGRHSDGDEWIVFIFPFLSNAHNTNNPFSREQLKHFVQSYRKLLH